MSSRWLALLLSLALLPAGLWLIDLGRRPPRITVSWETGSERDVVGFHLWRREPGGDAERVSPAMIPAEGSALTGAAYRYVDERVAPGRTYTYQIEELATDGTGTRLPDEVEIDAGGRGWIYLVEGFAMVLLGLWLTRKNLRDPDRAPLSRNPSSAPRP